ncbi:hypothetical protein ACTFIY_001505 [Dictyostelium cf. discoideum]
MNKFKIVFITCCILFFTIINNGFVNAKIEQVTANSNSSSNSSSSSTSNEFGKFSFQHFLIIIFVVGIMLFLSFSLIQVRIRLKNRMIDRIPRKIMPFLRPGDLSNKQRTIILNEIVRSKQIQSKIEPTMIGGNSVASNIGHLGWGPPNSEYSKVHFKTSISKSWIVLESAATHYSSHLKKDPKSCIRDYVEFLLEQCPQLDRHHANHYIDTYEKARFSDQEFTLEQYTQFMSNLIVLIKAFEFGDISISNNNNNNYNSNDPLNFSSSSNKLKIN